MRVAYFKRWWIQPSRMIKHGDKIWRFPEMGGPQNGWFIIEHPSLKWMITRGSPMETSEDLKIIQKIQHFSVESNGD